MTQHPSYDTDALDTATTHVSLPGDYVLVEARQITRDERTVWWFRHEPTDGSTADLGGEHISFVVDARAARLLGMTRMEARLAVGGLPDRETARTVAEEFLADAAPDLHGAVEVLWIEPHDETIAVDGRDVVVSGMKVKCRDQSGTYAWVIVGPRSEVVTFERDVIWNDDMSRRETEQWLHDDWLAKQTDSTDLE